MPQPYTIARLAAAAGVHVETISRAKSYFDTRVRKDQHQPKGRR
jgi:hypothetical protein